MYNTSRVSLHVWMSMDVCVYRYSSISVEYFFLSLFRRSVSNCHFFGYSVIIIVVVFIFSFLFLYLFIYFIRCVVGEA